MLPSRTVGLTFLYQDLDQPSLPLHCRLIKLSKPVGLLPAISSTLLSFGEPLFSPPPPQDLRHLSLAYISSILLSFGEPLFSPPPPQDLQHLSLAYISSILLSFGEPLFSPPPPQDLRHLSLAYNSSLTDKGLLGLLNRGHLKSAEDEEQHLPSFHGSSTCSSTSSSFSSTCSSSTCSSSTSTQCSSSWEAGAILRWGYPELFHVVMRQGNEYEQLFMLQCVEGNEYEQLFML